jgi:hypothetical protein
MFPKGKETDAAAALLACNTRALWRGTAPIAIGTYAEMFGGVELSFCQVTLTLPPGAAGVVLLRFIAFAIQVPS